MMKLRSLTSFPAAGEASRGPEALHAAVLQDSNLAAAIERHRGGEAALALCARFAAARPDANAKSLAMLRADMEYRDATSMLGLRSMAADQVLSADSKAGGLSCLAISLSSRIVRHVRTAVRW